MGAASACSPSTGSRISAARWPKFRPPPCSGSTRRLPPIWSHANPVDIAGDADGGRYTAAFEALLDDPENDAILVMNVPTALASATDAAQAVVEVTRKHRGRMVAPKPAFAVWVGGSSAAAASFEHAGIPDYATESEAVGGFMHLVRYREAQDALMATPPSLPADFSPDLPAARAVIEGALAAGTKWLDPVAATRLLAAYAIPVAPALLARDPDEAAAVAAPLLQGGSTVVAKILSPDIVHKSEVGGVRLNLTSQAAVREAVAEILARARAMMPQARITGVTIHPMILRPKARELIAGIADDPTFGPVIVFGRGGTAVEVIDDKALALPPLDLKLARDLMARTRVSRILKAYRDVAAADEGAIALVLVKLAQLAADFPQVREVDLNPFLADEDGLVAVDTRVAVAPVDMTRPGPSGHPRFAIRPYPKQWERHVSLADGSAILVRPVRPEDEPLYGPFFAGGHAPGSAHAVLRAGQGVQPRLHGALHPDRLRARHGVRRDRGILRQAPGRGAAACQRRLRHRRIRHPGAVRSQGARARLAADADDHRIRPRRGHRDHRGPGPAREHLDARHVPAARLPDHGRSG